MSPKWSPGLWSASIRIYGDKVNRREEILHQGSLGWSEAHVTLPSVSRLATIPRSACPPFQPFRPGRAR